MSTAHFLMPLIRKILFFHFQNDDTLYIRSCTAVFIFLIKREIRLRTGGYRHIRLGQFEPVDVSLQSEDSHKYGLSVKPYLRGIPA